MNNICNNELPVIFCHTHNYIIGYWAFALKYTYKKSSSAFQYQGQGQISRSQ